MRVSSAVHQSHPWVISRMAPEVELLDAWELPIQGSLEDFGAAVRLLEGFDPARSAPLLTRLLFRLRFWLGKRLGWDGASGPSSDVAAMFTPLYRTSTEWAAEISNATVHGVLQLCWVEVAEDRWRGELGIYVKPRGKLGRAYLKVIAPFRHLIVYPQLIGSLADQWPPRQLRSQAPKRSFFTH